MADRVKPGTAIVGLSIATLALAQTTGLPDPTRPSGVADASTPAGVPAAPAGLQAVILRPDGKSVAVINGQTVAVGEKVGDARLVSLNAREAVLSGPNGRETLKLAPAADKKLSEAGQKTDRMGKKTSRRGNGHE